MSEPRFLLDTGPLVAFLNPREEHHAWAVNVFKQVNSIFDTCEPVLTEAMYLLSRSSHGQDRFSDFCKSGILRIDFRLLDEIQPVNALLHKYRNIPMDLADACLVHLADQHRNTPIITTDRDFLLYRTKSRRQIPLIAPFAPPDN